MEEVAFCERQNQILLRMGGWNYMFRPPVLFRMSLAGSYVLRNRISGDRTTEDTYADNR
jgi:hypothetical protein